MNIGDIVIIFGSIENFLRWSQVTRDQFAEWDHEQFDFEDMLQVVGALVFANLRIPEPMLARVRAVYFEVRSPDKTKV